jgi:P pilus assembly chaperone PapD
MSPSRCSGWLRFALATLFSLPIAPACAGLSVTPVIVDFAPGIAPRGDIDLFNDGTERLYVVVEPSLIERPGTSAEQRTLNPDPQALGLLATPNRLILEPGQHKYVRVALLLDAGSEDRIYRVTIKPVAGAVEANTTGLKILVGFDILVIQRPANPSAQVTAVRSAASLVFHNSGNTNAELFNGTQCAGDNQCTKLPSHRLYGGTSWEVSVTGSLPVEYTVKIGTQITRQKY